MRVLSALLLLLAAFAALAAGQTCKPGGQYLEGAGCVLCNPSWYAPTGTSGCLPCPPGTASSSVGATACTACPARPREIATNGPPVGEINYMTNCLGACIDCDTCEGLCDQPQP